MEDPDGIKVNTSISSSEGLTVVRRPPQQQREKKKDNAGREEVQQQQQQHQVNDGTKEESKHSCLENKDIIINNSNNSLDEKSEKRDDDNETMMKKRNCENKINVQGDGEIIWNSTSILLNDSSQHSNTATSSNVSDKLITNSDSNMEKKKKISVQDDGEVIWDSSLLLNDSCLNNNSNNYINHTTDTTKSNSTTESNTNNINRKINVFNNGEIVLNSSHIVMNTCDQNDNNNTISVKDDGDDDDTTTFKKKQQHQPRNISVHSDGEMVLNSSGCMNSSNGSIDFHNNTNTSSTNDNSNALIKVKNKNKKKNIHVTHGNDGEVILNSSTDDSRVDDDLMDGTNISNSDEDNNILSTKKEERQNKTESSRATPEFIERDGNFFVVDDEKKNDADVSNNISNADDDTDERYDTSTNYSTSLEYPSEETNDSATDATFIIEEDKKEDPEPTITLEKEESMDATDAAFADVSVEKARKRGEEKDDDNRNAGPPLDPPVDSSLSIDEQQQKQEKTSDDGGQKKVNSFRPINPEEDDDCTNRSLDLLSRSEDDVPEPVYEADTSTNNINNRSSDTDDDDLNLSGEQQDPTKTLPSSAASRPSNPALPTTAMVGDKNCDIDSLQQHKDPDGDCDFLDQTLNLNISAIDTSVQESDITYTTAADLPSLVTSGIHDQNSILHHCDSVKSENASKRTAVKVVVSPASSSGEHKLTSRSDDQYEEFESILPADHGANLSVESLTSYISTEESCDGIELIRALSTQSTSEDSETKATKQQEVNDIALSDPLLSRLSRGKLNEDNSPIARLRGTRVANLGGRCAADPDGTVINKERDPALLGGLKKPSSRRSYDRPRPRVSFAAMHKGPHDEGRPDDTDDCEDESEVILNRRRRSRFAAYLRQRMMEFDRIEREDDEDSFDRSQGGERASPRRCQDGIPRVLDPTQCASVESSFTTLVSKQDTVEEGSTRFPAFDKMMRNSESKYDEESDSDSSSCTDSDYSSEDDDDAKLMSLFPYFFSESSKMGDEMQSDPIPKWFDDIAIPVVPQLEEFLKAARDFGRAETSAKVTQPPSNPEQDAISEFVEELENEAAVAPREEDSTTAMLPEQPPQSNHRQEETVSKVIRDKQVSNNQQDADPGTMLSAETYQEECGVLTLEDIQELAMMFASAIDASKKKDGEKHKMNQTSTRKAIDFDLDKSTEASWDNVEQTVDDHESLTGQSPQVRSKAHEKLTAKLEHIKKTQPQVYKVFLAKMAAAERAGRKFELRRDTDILINSPEKEKQQKELSSDEKPRSSLKADEMSVQNSVVDSVTIQVDEMQPSEEWETFDGSPFKESIKTDSKDASSGFDDLQWINSTEENITRNMETFMDGPMGKENFASTVESLMDGHTARENLTSTVESFFEGQKKMAFPLKERLAQYSKTHPNFYRVIMSQIREREAARAASTQKFSSSDVADVSSSGLSQPTPTGKENDAVKSSPKCTSSAQLEPLNLTCSGGNMPKQTNVAIKTPMCASAAEFEPRVTREKCASIDSKASQPSDIQRSREISSSAFHSRTETGMETTAELESPGGNVTRGASSKFQATRVTNASGDGAKQAFAQKVEFFAKNSRLPSIHEKSESVKSPSKSCATDAVEQGEKNCVSSASKHLRQSDSSDLEIQKKIISSVLQKNKNSTTDRSNTPINPGNPSKYELLATPRSSNRTEAKHQRPDVVRGRKLFHSDQVLPATESSNFTNCTSPPPASANDEAKVQTSSTASSSPWETFEGSSTFKDSIQASTGIGNKEENSDAVNQMNETAAHRAEMSPDKDGLPHIKLHTSFLDSILPPPPSFQQDIHHQQRDPWEQMASQSQKLTEQWEFFSPVDFEVTAKQWGVEGNTRSSVTSRPRFFRKMNKAKTRSSPSSIAEF